MIFELPDIFFGSHKKRKGITTTAGETVRIYKKGRKSLTTSGFFKKSGDIFFGATSQKVLISCEIRTFSALLRPISYLLFFLFLVYLMVVYLQILVLHHKYYMLTLLFFHLK